MATLRAYGRQCAVTRERAIPALDAAHIRDYSERPEHEDRNGLLLRSDVHRLFDAGYVTVTPHYEVEVSHRVRDDFNDGENYLRLHGEAIVVPGVRSGGPTRRRWRRIMTRGSGARMNEPTREAMSGMETLKALHEITAADPRHAKSHSIGVEIPDEYRPPTLADLHQEMVDLALPESVPETIRSAFSVARTLWLYGWYYWAFHTVAEYEAVRCVEMALRAKCEAEGAYDPKPKSRRNRERIGLKGLFDIAMERAWVSDSGFRNFHRLQAGEARLSLPPGTIRSEWQRGRFSDDPTCYTKRVFESLRYMRNWRFHPERHSHTMPDNARLTMELAHDLIRQLFPSVL